GRIESRQREFTVTSSTDLQSTEQFRNVIVATVNGYPVRLSDVADVQIGPLDDRVLARFNGQSSLTIGITKQATANPFGLSSYVRQDVEDINKNLPAGMKLDVTYDSSVFIQDSIKSVYATLIEAIVLVVLVIFFFLR